MHAPPPPSSSNFTRWLALGVESNAWSLVFLSNATTVAMLLSVWLGVTFYGPTASGAAALDVLDPAFAAFPLHTSQQRFLQLSVDVFGKLGVVLPLLCFYLVGFRLPHTRLARVVDAIASLLFALAIAVPVALVLAQRSFAAQTQLLAAPRDTSMDTPFNDFYCSARTATLCGVTATMSEDTAPIDKLLDVFEGDARAAGEDSNRTQAMENIVIGCRHIYARQYQLHQHTGSVSQRQQAFLRHCNTSDATDSWCGEYILTNVRGFDRITSRLGDAASRESSPASLNSAVFDEYLTAWRNRLEFDAIMLGVVCLVVLVFCIAWTKMLASDKRPGARSNRPSVAKAHGL